MITVNLHTTDGERLTIQVKTGWHDVTTAEYLDMQGKSETELLQWLTGLTPEQLAALDDSAALYFTEMLAEFSKPSEVDVEAETLGQFETVRSFMGRLYREEPETYRLTVLPYIYGQYRSGKVGGKWKNSWAMRLTEYAKTLPVAELFAFAVPVLTQIETVIRKYDDLCRDSDNTDEAGGSDLEAFGIYPVINMLSGGDITRHDAIMQQSVRSVYTHLYYLNVQAKSQKEEANG